MSEGVFADGKRVVTLLPGDGIGPEIAVSVKAVLAAAGAQIAWEERRAGASVFKEGIVTGVPDDTVESIRRTRVVLKGPLETPIGFGEKSANVTLRKLFETYANVRPARELPGIVTPYSGRGIDLVVVRENIEDLYAGIEHMQTPGVAQALKLITRKGCEKIVRFAFEFARSEGRTNVVVATKSNILKLTEGMLKRTFEEIAPEYPDIESWHIIVDNAAHQLVKKPEQFDVLVMTNMNGDILSDLTSGLVGGLGFAPSANYGSDVAIFEAVHGSAPKYAGKNVINPTALLATSVMLLRHIGDFDAAADVEHALSVTLESGQATRDVVGDGGSALSTTEFTQAVIDNLGKRSERISDRPYKPIVLPRVTTDTVMVRPKSRRVLGVDVFVESPLKPIELGPIVERLAEGTRFRLKMLSNRGTKVYPATGAMTDTVDQSRARMIAADGGAVSDAEILELLARIGSEVSWAHIEKLQEFDGEPAYTKAQGED